MTPDGQGGDGDAAVVEDGQEVGEAPAPLAEEVLGGDPAVGEGQPVGVRGVPAHLPVGRLHLEARGAGRDDDGADLGLAGCRGSVRAVIGDDRRDVGAGVGDERLLAVDDPLVGGLVEHGAGAGAAGVAAGLGLRSGRSRRGSVRRTGRAASAASAPRCRTVKIGLAPRPTPASRVIATDWSTRASSSMAMHSVVKSAPEPPYSSGKGRPNSPSSPMARTASGGKVVVRSHSSA